MPPNTVVKPFTVIGKVTHGEEVGRTIGFPTANINNVPEREELKPGVYAGVCSIYDGAKLRWERLPCLPYFGPRHIFGETHDVFEVYIYNFDQTIYDHNMEVTLTHFIREPKEIKSLQELQTQLEADKRQGLALQKT
jgi:riboflavin kinase / FMN adenylyltransferase